MVVEADEEERGQARHLPEEEEDEEVVGHDAADHRQHERRQRAVEPPLVRVPREISARVDEDARADPRDEEEHERGEPVEAEGEVDAE